jgi:hypothetical protein
MDIFLNFLKGKINFQPSSLLNVQTHQKMLFFKLKMFFFTRGKNEKMFLDKKH